MTALALIPDDNYQGDFDETSASMLVRGDIENAQKRLLHANTHIAKLLQIEDKVRRMRATWESVARNQESLLVGLRRIN